MIRTSAEGSFASVGTSVWSAEETLGRFHVRETGPLLHAALQSAGDRFDPALLARFFESAP
ncbi:MAG: hypothetical protein AAGE52_05745 [Myxococcota bacterium]